MQIPIKGNDDNSDDSVNVRILIGEKELMEKVLAVMSALGEAGLSDEAQMFHDRVIAPALKCQFDQNRVLEYERLSHMVFRCQYKPMVELLLDEMKAIATAPGLTETMRKERIAEYMTMAGF